MDESNSGSVSLDAISTCSSDGCLDDWDSDTKDDMECDWEAILGKAKVILTFIVGAVAYYNNYLHKTPCHDREASGWSNLMSMLRGNDRRSRDNLRMSKEVFYSLCKTLVEFYGLKPLKYVTVEEQVVTFLMIVGSQEGNRQLQEFLQRSGFTISKSWHLVLVALKKISVDWIRPFDDHLVTPSYIKDNPRYYPHFKDCIGAIDGTHVMASLRVTDQIPYIGRKGKPTQNCMAVCDFDMCFMFVVSDWKGSAHDTRIFYDTIRYPTKGYPTPPPGTHLIILTLKVCCLEHKLIVLSHNEQENITWLTRAILI